MFQVKQEDIKDEIEDIECLPDIETHDEFSKCYKKEHELTKITKVINNNASSCVQDDFCENEAEYNTAQLHTNLSLPDNADDVMTSSGTCTLLSNNKTSIQNNNSEENDLRILLKSWDQEYFFDHFTDEKVNIKILKIIKRHHIRHLLRTFKMGDIILFEFNLENWRQEIGIPLDFNDKPIHVREKSVSGNVDNFDLGPKRYTPYTQISSARNSSPSPELGDIVCLNDILNKNKKGQLITEFFEKNKKFEDEQRNMLINTITQYYEGNDIHLSLPTSYSIENEILERFPSEKMEYYRIGKRGKIYIKYCNMKRASKALLVKNTEEEIEKQNKSRQKLIPEADAQQCIQSLKYDNLSAEEFDSMWQACCQYRLDEILNKSSSLQDIFEKWPEYKKPTGSRLIDKDFLVMYPKTSDIFTNTTENLRKIKNFLSKRIKDKTINQTLNDIGDDFDTDSAAVRVLWCLHAYLVPTQKYTKIDNNKKCTFKYTIKDSQETFLFVSNNIQQIEEHLAHLKTKSEHIQPFILAVGDKDLNKFERFYLYLDGVKLMFNSFLRAVDICFKSFHLFDLKYPIAAEYFWTWVELFFYKLDKPVKSKSSKVYVMLDEIKSY